MENLEIFNKLRTVPEKAQKKITGGRLSGMTDIKPMWRIEKLTEEFGVCGIGWYTETTHKEIIEGANGEKIATVDILLYVKVDGEWSKGIEGSGGSSFIAKEKNGLYTSDECFKMAYTDALSVACKSLGMGADVYWGDSKYASAPEPTKEDAENYVFKSGKHMGKKILEVPANYRTWWLNEGKDEYVKKCITLLTGELPFAPENATEVVENDKKKLKLLDEIFALIEETKTDEEKILKEYKVEDIQLMSIEQLESCKIVLLKKKEKAGK